MRFEKKLEDVTESGELQMQWHNPLYMIELEFMRAGHLKQAHREEVTPVIGHQRVEYGANIHVSRSIQIDFGG